jgi:15-cis-phytoene synthase
MTDATEQMRAHYQHCESVVRDGDRDRYIAALFAPADRRPHLHALYAFDRELSLVPHRVHEALAGEVRLQWWRDALAGEARGDAAAHPVAAALIDTVARCRLPVEPLDALIDARAYELYEEPFATIEDCAVYGRQTASTVLELACRILDPAAEVGAAAAPAGVAAAFAGLLQSFPQDVARGRLFLPLDVLERNGVRREELGAGRAPPQLRAAVQEIADRAREQLAEARRARDAVTPDARPAFLPLATVAPLLERLARDPDPFRPAGLAPWRRQWLMWRAARRGVF